MAKVHQNVFIFWKQRYHIIAYLAWACEMVHTTPFNQVKTKQELPNSANHEWLQGPLNASIASFYLNPLQLRIADVVAIGPKDKPKNYYPEIAIIDKQTIIIKPHIIKNWKLSIICNKLIQIR